MLPIANVHINVQPLLLGLAQRRSLDVLYERRRTYPSTRIANEQRLALEPALAPRLQHGGLVWVWRSPHRAYDVEQRASDGRRGSVDGRLTSALVNQSATPAAASPDV